MAWYSLTPEGEIVPEAVYPRNMDEMKPIKSELVDNKYLVSTVFLGLDHGFPTNPDRPLVFETMVFKTDLNGEVHDWGEKYCERYYTLVDAVYGHEDIVARLKREELGLYP